SSQVGRGSRFSVEIDAPMVREHGFHQLQPGADAPAAPPRPAHDHDLRGLRVLFAEDGPDNQRLISHLLRRRGASVEIVDNGRDAVNRVLDAASPGYDVLLLDMQMPIMDGYQAAATLRAGGHAGPILALTANVLPVDRKRCLAAGCDDYASKPIDVDDLCSKLGRLTGRAKSGT
ncbi:MAG: response regulator, partial [Phycisphaerales bacterium]|nr:response regulator [Phycisphaerales bacterium]